jgi:hypothetical protein
LGNPISPSSLSVLLLSRVPFFPTGGASIWGAPLPGLAALERSGARVRTSAGGRPVGPVGAAPGGGPALSLRGGRAGAALAAQELEARQRSALGGLGQKVGAPSEVSARLTAMAQEWSALAARERSSGLAVPRRGDSARTRTGGAVEPRMEDVGGRLRRRQRTRSGGTASCSWRTWRWPGVGRPRSSRRRRSGYGAASRKEKRQSEGGGRA